VRGSGNIPIFSEISGYHTAASMKRTLFWEVAPCSLVDGMVREMRLIALMMEAVSTSETWVNFY
jgi:hypothetical protein